MIRTTVDIAETQFRELIEAALRGEDVLITTTGDDDQLAVRISRVPSPEDDKQPRPQFGSAKGKIWMSEDFDEPLDDFKDYQ